MLALCYISNKIPLNSHSGSVTAASAGVMSSTCRSRPICQACASLCSEKQLVSCKAAAIGTACQCESVTRWDPEQGRPFAADLLPQWGAALCPLPHPPGWALPGDLGGFRTWALPVTAGYYVSGGSESSARAELLEWVHAALLGWRSREVCVRKVGAGKATSCSKSCQVQKSETSWA